MNQSITILFLSLLLGTLLVSHCNVASTPLPRAQPTASAIVVVTNSPVVTSTITIEPAITPMATMVLIPSTMISTTDWNSHRIRDIGVELLLPPEWNILRFEGGYFARPTSVQSEIDPAAFALVLSNRQDDLPQEISALTAILAPRLGENEPDPLTTQSTTLGGHTGIAFLGFQNVCMEIFVPAEGVIQEVDIATYFCTGESTERQLTAEGQAILNSIRFFSPTSD